MPERRKMVSKYEVGDTVLLSTTIESIKVLPKGITLYKVKHIDLPVLEKDIVARVESPWILEKRKTE